ncbi:MAG: GNAT family N-acetyltransferase [Coprobacillus sp.]|nr:GNAT family N-acetyltransferase [Coprobacillus sp.]
MKKLKLEDYQIIKPYLDLANYEGYNSNFVTMMMWNHEYHIEYEIHEYYMIMLHNYKGTYFWAMPFTSKEYYIEAIEYMRQYSYEHHFDFIIDCAIEDFVTEIKDVYKDTLLFQRTPSNDDYIYDKKMLQTLSGKKMQKRRNHYNAFLKNYPQYIYRDLDTKEDFDIILNCLNKWETNKDDLSESMTSEIFGIMYLLSSKKLLNFKVGGIFIDDVMEAFIIASQLKHQTIQIHVEKANKNIRGLYPAILKEMLDHHFPNELYINREEDMGLENLKKSKQSLHPIKMIHKYKITEKSFKIQQPSDEEKQQIIDLWKICFQDETEKSTNYYFNNLYHKENTYVLKQKNKIISVLQIVPMTIHLQNQNQQCYFILGVCTHPLYQGQGVMKKLLNHVLTLYHDKRIYLQAYNPKIYYKFGFDVSHLHQKIEIDNNILYKERLSISSNSNLLKDYYQIFVKNFDEYRIRDNDYWEQFIKRCHAFDDRIVIIQNYGYMVYHEDENSVYISEFIYLNNEAILHLLNYFYSFKKSIFVECDLKANIPGEKKKITAMMCLSLEKDEINDNKFVNEIY